MSKTAIHTVDARDNIMLQFVRDQFDVSPAVMHREIRGLHAETVRLLAAKGIDYAKLNKALVPQPDRREIALVFDTLHMQESWYGLPIHKRLLPALHRKSSRSILCGDYIGEVPQSLMRARLLHELNVVRSFEYRHGTQFYIVYVNNLSDAMFTSLDQAFRDFEPYVGYADMTFLSPLKIHLSLALVNSYIQHGNVIIGQHEDDAPPDEDWNLPGYPFEDYGYRLRSIAGDPFGVLLSYKIERPVFPGFEEDTEFSLNALHPTPMPLAEMDIHITEERFEYLEGTPGHGVRAGEAGTVDELKALIREKIEHNYIYDMVFDAEWNVSRFNVVLQLGSGAGRYRVRAGLKYQPEAKQLELITLY